MLFCLIYSCKQFTFLNNTYSHMVTGFSKYPSIQGNIISNYQQVDWTEG